MNIPNQQLAKLFREIAAAYTIKKLGNVFQIRAYDNAADSIEHSTAEIQDLWQEGKLKEFPGFGQKTREYLEELFTKGKVEHFEEVKKGIPDIVFDLLDVPGVGPKTALEISSLGVKDIPQLKAEIKSGKLVEKGFSGKIAQKIMDGLSQINNRDGRMLLPYAFAQAEKILDYLKQSPSVLKADPLGSLRRMVATIGDLDFAVASKDPKKVVDYFCQYPLAVRVLDQGENQTSIVLQSGIRVDLLVGEPDSYGALLQHFTGSKNHNIHLRTLAEKKGLSLSEYGIKKSHKLIATATEKEFYEYLGMDVPPSEIREDIGEIEAALEHKLPKLVELKDIKGDMHLHSNFPIQSPSHGPGVDSIEEIVNKAINLGYDYVGISDHPPGFTTAGKENIIRWAEKRTKFVQQLKKSKKSIRVQHAESNTFGVRILNGLEIDILGDGSLSVPDEALETLDYCIAGIHSGHRGSKEEITKRLIKALESPHVDIISHPTNRLLNERDSSDADWDEVFKYAAKYNKILEINSSPNRLDLRDDLVRAAKKYGVKFIIDTDAHAVSQMDNMKFGVSVARRGWATKEDIVNTWDWTDLAKWFKLGLD